MSNTKTNNFYETRTPPNFEGNCEEASIITNLFSLETLLTRSYYRNAPMNVPESHKDRILHCQLDFESNTILACDSFPGQAIDNGTGYALSLGFDSEADASVTFEKLADGGTVTMPFQKTILRRLVWPDSG